MGEITAKIVEVFPSFQGEGLYVGEPQVFVRFCGCNLRCAYCDTDFDRPSRQMGADEVLERISELSILKDYYHSVSLTGGEPLLHFEFLKEFLPKLKDKGFKIYLETNGTFPHILLELIDLIDIISMDIKLPSSAKIEPLWELHREFLKIARGSDCFVKVILTKNTLKQDLIEAMNIVDEIDRAIPFVLQPVTPTKDFKEKMEFSQIMGFYCLAKTRLDNVRVIPQMHKRAGLR